MLHTVLLVMCHRTLLYGVGTLNNKYYYYYYVPCMYVMLEYTGSESRFVAYDYLQVISVIKRSPAGHLWSPYTRICLYA